MLKLVLERSIYEIFVFHNAECEKIIAINIVKITDKYNNETNCSDSGVSAHSLDILYFL